MGTPTVGTSTVGTPTVGTPTEENRQQPKPWKKTKKEKQNHSKYDPKNKKSKKRYTCLNMIKRALYEVLENAS